MIWLAKVEDIISEMADPLIEEIGLELVDVQFVKEGSEWYLRIFIDKEDGINLDDCVDVSNLISEKLDENDPITQAYHLEVSSPGVERPLKKTKDFIRFKGSLVEIKIYSALNGKKNFVGTLDEVNEEEISIIENEEKIVIPREKIAKANLAWEG